MSVIVAVWVWPFNLREQKLNSKLCVDMIENKTILKNDD